MIIIRPIVDKKRSSLDFSDGMGMTKKDRNNLDKAFEELSIELTHKCTLNCIYCSSSADISKNDFIDLSRIKEIIAEVRDKFGVNTISLSGGETFLYPYFWDLYNYLTDNEFDIHIYTSGIIQNQQEIKVCLSKEIFRKLYLQKNNPRIILNIQGHNKELVEKINGVPGSFELIEKTIENISSESVYLGAHIVPFKYNFKFLKEIVDYCWKKSFDEVNFLRFVPQGRGSNYGLFNTRSEFAEINETIKTILKRNQSRGSKIDIRLGHPINFLFLTGDENLYNKEKTHYCRGGLDAPIILPNGEVSMCPAWKDLKVFSGGNIYNQNFSEIWNSINFKLFRDFVRERYKNIKEPCRSCEYLESCRGKCVAQRLLAQKDKLNTLSLEELILFGPDPQCFKHNVVEIK